MGVASSATSSTISMSSTWASVVPAGKVPKDTAHHFDGLSARPRASVSRRSPRSRAHRGHRAGFLGVGSGVALGQRRPRAGHCRRLWERLWGRRLELGANTYRVLVPRSSTGGRDGGSTVAARPCTIPSGSYLLSQRSHWRSLIHFVGGSWGLDRAGLLPYGWHQHEQDSPHGLAHPSMC